MVLDVWDSSRSFIYGCRFGGYVAVVLRVHRTTLGRSLIPLPSPLFLFSTPNLAVVYLLLHLASSPWSRSWVFSLFLRSDFVLLWRLFSPNDKGFEGVGGTGGVGSCCGYCWVPQCSPNGSVELRVGCLFDRRFSFFVWFGQRRHGGDRRRMVGGLGLAAVWLVCVGGRRVEDVQC